MYYDLQLESLHKRRMKVVLDYKILRSLVVVYHSHENQEAATQFQNPKWIIHMHTYRLMTGISCQRK